MVAKVIQDLKRKQNAFMNNFDTIKEATTEISSHMKAIAGSLAMLNEVRENTSYKQLQKAMEDNPFKQLQAALEDSSISRLQKTMKSGPMAKLQNIVDSLEHENKKLQKEISELRRTQGAESSADDIKEIGGAKFIGKVLDGFPPKDLKPMAAEGEAWLRRCSFDFRE